MLGDWEVRSRHGTLLHRKNPAAGPIHVEPRVMGVLICLARHAGEVVTRDELLAEVWAGRIVSDEALSRCISLLRGHFADDPREPRVIRTVSRVGYLLVPKPVPLATEGEASPPELPRTTVTPARRWVHVGVVALSLLLVVGGLLVRFFPRTSDAAAHPTANLVVLPFDTHAATAFGHDVGVEFADEISDALSPVSGVRIHGRASNLTAATSLAEAVLVGRRLGVDDVVFGSVAGPDATGSLRISVQMVSIRDSRLLWSETYESRAPQIFRTQSRIASAVVREVGGYFSRAGLIGVPSVEPETRDVEAYRLYLRGTHQVRLRGEDSLRLAIDLYAAAIRRDPSYARAYVGLATAYSLLPAYSIEDPVEMYARADEAIANAERLAGHRTLTAGIRAYLGFQRWQWTDAEAAYRTAIAADPNDSDLRQQYSQLLGSVGRLQPAAEQARLAQELDPLAPVIADRVGIVDLWLGRDVDAARQFALARELGLEHAAYPETKVILKLHEHRDAEAATLLHTLQHAVGRTDAWIEPVLAAYRHPESRPAMVADLDRLLDSGGISLKVYFGAMVLLESPGRALRSFGQLAERNANDLELLFSGDAAAVRRDPGFGDFAHRLRLDAYWDEYGWPETCRREAKEIRCR